MSSDSESHWHATSFPLMVGPVPATFFIPLPLMFFWRPTLLVIASLVWMVLVVWLARKGLGVVGLAKLVRRALQGDRLVPRRRRPPK